jgi:L-2-hydroxyglutarate oxidase LhgO
MPVVETADFLVIGGGVIGINLATGIKLRYPQSRVLLIEKETHCGSHASGRNSGVIHAGFYYSSDSLKARFTRDGNRELTQYCSERKLRINRCGKLVVAKTEQEGATLDELVRRGRANGVELHELTPAEARKIEPRVRTVGKALFSPTTASVDPLEVMGSLVEDARAAGVEIVTGTAYLGRAGESVRTSKGAISAGYVINAAGLYADRVARDFGFSQNYRILPFKGLYLYSDEPVGSFRTNIYPVPDLRNPFLGVHFTITVDGHAKIGPTAIPAFWRENYAGFSRFNIREMLEVTGLELGLLWRNEWGFRHLAAEELSKQSRRKMVRLAGELAIGVTPNNYSRWGKPGIRAQLYDLRQHRLEMDFRFEGDARSFHVLNAVSPAFTCAVPFTRYLIDEIAIHLSGAGERR